MKYFILIFFQLIICKSAFSCAGAFQRKLFPLGEVNNQLVFREVNIQRTAEGLHMKVKTRLLYFNYELSFVKAIVSDSAIFGIDTFYSNNKKYYEKLVWQDLKIEKKFVSIEYAYGDYLDSTSFAEIREDMDSIKVYFKFTGKKEREIVFYPVVDTGEEVFDGVKRPENCPASLMVRGIHLGLVTRYNFGEKSLIILHLCNSDANGDAEMDWIHVEQPFMKATQESFLLNGMASHSYGSDVMFWE